MWQAVTQKISSGKKYRLSADDKPLSYRQFIDLLRRDEEFSSWYSNLLAASDFSAFYWELPPLTLDSFEQEAEFVLINAPALASLEPDPAPFQSHFDAAPENAVLTFPNLGGDAILIVPRPLSDTSAYPHLATFVRNAPNPQVLALWQQTAEALYQNVTSAPRWLSTAGLGVAWLHVRIDTRPKYYSHAPYTHRP